MGRSIQLVPRDWDVLRWDCWQHPLPYFKWFSNFSYSVSPLNDTVLLALKNRTDTLCKENISPLNDPIFLALKNRTDKLCKENQKKSKHKCWYCGGTHAVMWRSDSVQKLRDVWSERPYDDIDCRLTHKSLKSYCINIGVGHFHKPKNEKSDVTKHRKPKKLI